MTRGKVCYSKWPGREAGKYFKRKKNRELVEIYIRNTHSKEDYVNGGEMSLK